jgi:hypothetical protein
MLHVGPCWVSTLVIMQSSASSWVASCRGQCPWQLRRCKRTKGED